MQKNDQVQGFEPKVTLAGLSPALIHATTETAQRFLASAHDSVAGLIASHNRAMTLSQQAPTAPPGLFRVYDPRDRPALIGQALDARRAMVVFGGAGLDATVKQLIRDAMPSLLEVSDQARRKLLDFTEEAIRKSEVDGSRTLAEVLVSADPRKTLLDRYVYRLTGSSLQSADQLQVVAGSLGVSEAPLRRRLAGLRAAFLARNQIVHELDLLDPSRHGQRSRRERGAAEAVEMAHELLECGQLLVNSVAELLGGGNYYATTWPD